MEEKHGAHCPKVVHIGKGYLHGENNDGPYDVDGVDYCGRCHARMGIRLSPAPAEEPKEWAAYDEVQEYYARQVLDPANDPDCRPAFRNGHGSIDFEAHDGCGQVPIFAVRSGNAEVEAGNWILRWRSDERTPNRSRHMWTVNSIKNLRPVSQSQPQPEPCKVSLTEEDVLDGKCVHCGYAIWGEGCDPKTRKRFYSHAYIAQPAPAPSEKVELPPCRIEAEDRARVEERFATYSNLASVPWKTSEVRALMEGYMCRERQFLAALTYNQRLNDLVRHQRHELLTNKLIS